jgi:hypothetical protein
MNTVSQPEALALNAVASAAALGIAARTDDSFTVPEVLHPPHQRLNG